jgi:ABC-type glutathione transport system ATPase component
MRDMMSRAKIMVVVSHDLDSLAAVCEKGVWLHRGRVRMTGPMSAVIDAYKEHAARPSAENEEGPVFPEFMVPDALTANAAEEESSCTGFPQLEACSSGVRS